MMVERDINSVLWRIIKNDSSIKKKNNNLNFDNNIFNNNLENKPNNIESIGNGHQKEIKLSDFEKYDSILF